MLSMVLVVILCVFIGPTVSNNASEFSLSQVSTRELKQELYSDLDDSSETIVIYVKKETETKKPDTEETKVIPGDFGYIDQQNNVFGRPILAGYYLKSEHNAEIAANIINDYIIQPADVFSFNDSVGERTRDKGYIEGRAISGDQYVPSVGGGVCKTSTALYRAAQQVGLEIVEAHQHTLPVSYASRGQDAAVAWNVLDLKIQNNIGQPITILTKCQSGKIYLGLALISDNTANVVSDEIEN